MLGSVLEEQGIRNREAYTGQAEPMASYGRSSVVSVFCLELDVARCRRTIFAE